MCKPGTASCHDVANYILKTRGEMTAMKLQKLLYYAQAWSLVWEERELFPEAIEAWASGPVVVEVYEKHRDRFLVDGDLYPSDSVRGLTPDDRANINKVLDFYGERTTQWLTHLAHQEQPWLESRGTTPRGAPSRVVISTALMHEYYSGLSETVSAEQATSDLAGAVY